MGRSPIYQVPVLDPMLTVMAPRDYPVNMIGKYKTYTDQRFYCTDVQALFNSFRNLRIDFRDPEIPGYVDGNAIVDVYININDKYKLELFQ